MIVQKKKVWSKPKKLRKNTYKRKYDGKIENPDRIQNTIIWRGLGILPDRYVTKLRYNEQLSRGGAIIDTYVFNANNMFDPNQTGTGSQPTGFNELTGLWRKFRVLACSAKLKIANQSTMAMLISLTPTLGASTTFPTGYNDAVRLPYAKSKIIGGIAGQNVGYIKNYINCTKFEGNKQYRNEDSYTGTGSSGVGADYMQRWFINATAADLATNMLYNMDVELTFYAEFFERIQLPQS